MTDKERNDYFYVCELINIFNSFISDEISNFNSDLYYQNPDYLEWSYREGKLLDFLPVLTAGRFSNWVNTVSPI